MPSPTPRQRLSSIAVVGAGGFLGGMLRFLLDQVAYREVPISTLAINVLGAFLLPILAAWIINNDQLRLFFTTGFISSFTTFSAISGTVMVLSTTGSVWLAVLYVVATMLLGITAAVIGSAVARRRTS